MPRPIKDIRGQKFYSLTALEPIKKNGRTYYKCRCDCGKEIEVCYTNLIQEKTKSCGCKRGYYTSISKLQDISNQKFGRLTAIKIDHREPPKTYWLCKCDCGNTKVADINQLTQGKIKSCGCLQKENTKKLAAKNYNNLIGRRFGKLVVLEDSRERTKTGNVIWKCQCDCGNLTNVSGTHLLCGDTISCGCIVSKGETVIKSILSINEIFYQTQKTFDNCINPITGSKLFFDFYLPDYNCCIEYDGEQHFNAREAGYFTSETVKEIQHRDRVKEDFCKKHNIKLIRVPYTDYDKLSLEYIKNRINKNNV